MQRFLCFFLILALFVLSACFQTRQVEPPDTSGSAWIPPTDYQILLQNFRTAVQSLNTQNYSNCFAPQAAYTFVSAPEVYNNHENVWQNWTTQEERSYFENLKLIAPVGGGQMELKQVDLQTLGNSSLLYVGEYKLKLAHSDTAITQTIKGQITLELQLNSNNWWEIKKWQDIETAPDSSWSRWKLHFY